MSAAAMLALGLLTGAIPLEVSDEPDGLELLTVRTGPEQECHVRLVVRAGAAQDPAKLSGMAHVVEHILLSRHFKWSSNLELNGATFSDATIFTINTGTEDCETQLESLLRYVSDPDLLVKRLDRERDVISHEERMRTGLRRDPGLDSLLSSSSLQALLGTNFTRAAITPDTLQQFFMKHYQPANMTLIVVSPLAPEEVRSAIHRGFRLPPSMPDEKVARRVPAVALPIQGPSLVRGSVTTAVRVPSPKGCQLLGSLLELRLMDPSGQEVVTTQAVCLLRAGAHWLVISSTGEDVDRERVAQRTWKLVTGAKVATVGKAERKLLERRLAASKEIPTARGADQVAEDLAQYARWYTGAQIAEFLPPTSPGFDAELSDLQRLAPSLIDLNTVIWGYQPDDATEVQPDP